MRNGGFTLVEMIVVMALLALLMTISTLQFNRYVKKSGIESQMKTMHAEIMKVRSRSLLERSSRSFGVTANDLLTYSAPDGGGAVAHNALKYPVVSDTSIVINFNSMGVASTSMTICIAETGNDAAVDSIRVTPTMVQMGKRSGTSCDSGSFRAN